jgi:AcrR family transcriptional regulator
MNQPDLTPKAQQTRQHILDIALALFAERGYVATTMRDIADAAGCSLGLAYRYFSRKEELVLALYAQMAADTTRQIATLARAPVAERFYRVMERRLNDAAPHREALGALFGTMADPNSGVSILAAGPWQAETRRAFVQLVAEASDAPRDGQIDSLATLLRSLHFALILFWLYDRSPDQRATAGLLAFVRETLATLRAAMVLPLISGKIERLAAIMSGLFDEGAG